MDPVLICIRERILETGVISLLNATDDLRVIRVADKRTIKGDILKMQPCVVILDANGRRDQTAQLVEFLETLPKLRIILVHPESNVVEVYDKHEISLSNAADLLNIIHESRPAASPIQT